MSIDKETRERNRQSWNAATVAHNSHKRDQAAFLRDGGSTLFPEEVELLGDLRGRRLAHLMCNCGQDSLSLAARGAEVTGVDISDEAVAFARNLAKESGISARFARSDAFDWLDKVGEQGERFDVVFCSYGALCWLSSLERFASGVASLLVPGGVFVAVEFHPVLYMFEFDGRVAYPYFGTGEAVETAGVPDYVGEAGEALSPSGFEEGAQGFENPHPDHTYPWGLAQVVSAFLGAGLGLERFEEYPYTNGATFMEGMRPLPGRRYGPPNHLPGLPLMYGLRLRL